MIYDRIRAGRLVSAWCVGGDHVEHGLEHVPMPMHRLIGGPANLPDADGVLTWMERSRPPDSVLPRRGERTVLLVHSHAAMKQAGIRPLSTLTGDSPERVSRGAYATHSTRNLGTLASSPRTDASCVHEVPLTREINLL